ncbi:MAG: hypothetical protein V4507_15955, partial [Verrucomicrobiota bacterium]
SMERPMFRYDASWKNSAVNKKWIDITVGTEFDRLNGERARRGDPLISSAFPLSWISKLEDGSTSSAWIEKAFGLQKNGDYWIYTGGDGTLANTINTIDQVRAKGRDANFFELLKLGIEESSLGVSAGYTCSRARGIDANKDYQIIRIGANIIDQFDSNHEPTVIRFSTEEFYGLEDLPYINKMAQRPEHIVGATSPPFYLYILPELWNNHRRLVNSKSTDLYPNIRIKAAADSWFGPGYRTTGGSFVQYPAGVAGFSTAPATLGSDNLEYYREPHLIRRASGLELSSQTPPAVPSDITGVSGYKFNYGAFPAGVTPANYNGMLAYYSNTVMYAEYQNSSGNWIPYHTFLGMMNNGASTMGRTNGIHPVSNGAIGSASVYSPVIQGAGAIFTLNPLRFNSGVVKSDPRTTRFGGTISAMGLTGINTFFGDRSLRPEFSWINLGYKGYAGYTGTGTSTQPWSLGETKLGYFGGIAGSPESGLLASMAENRYSYDPNAPCSYFDLDGVKRWGDYGLDSSPYVGPQKINPYRPNEQSYRPIVLDRPFNSVGELGYIYRDMPWKSLDMFTTNSADMVLLDLFDTYEHPRVVGGKVSWNVPYPEIWKTLVIGADRVYGASNPQTISENEASSIAQTIFQSYAGKANVIVSRSDMIRSIANTNVNETWPIFKHHREAVVRQIAEVGQSSTINLMMDLVVEDGKTRIISQQQTPIFVPQGRRRFWVSVALDRLTYKIIDMQIEEVL